MYNTAAPSLISTRGAAGVAFGELAYAMGRPELSPVDLRDEMDRERYGFWPTLGRVAGFNSYKIDPLQSVERNIDGMQRRISAIRSQIERKGERYRDPMAAARYFDRAYPRVIAAEEQLLEYLEDVERLPALD
jgi:hypothetical protein